MGKHRTPFLNNDVISLSERNKTPEQKLWIGVLAKAFEDAFNDITSKISYLEGGTGFYDKSALNHIHSEYQFKSDNSKIKIGANFRQYQPDSKGSIFMDTASTIINNEFGVYTGASFSSNFNF